MEAKDLEGLINDSKTLADFTNGFKDRLQNIISSMPENNEQRAFIEKQLDDVSKILNKIPSEIANAVNNRG